MPINWLALRRHPQSYGLFLGTVLGYGLLIILAGNRPATWGGGGAIASSKHTNSSSSFKIK